MIDSFGNELFINDVYKKYPVLEPYIKNHLSYCVPTRVVVTNEPVTFLGELYMFTKYALLMPSNIEFKHYMENYFKPRSDCNKTHPNFRAYDYIMTEVLPTMDDFIYDNSDKWCRYSFSSSFANPNLTTIIYIKCYDLKDSSEDVLNPIAFVNYISFYDRLNDIIDKRLKDVVDSCQTDTASH